MPGVAVGRLDEDQWGEVGVREQEDWEEGAPNHHAKLQKAETSLVNKSIHNTQSVRSSSCQCVITPSSSTDIHCRSNSPMDGGSTGCCIGGGFQAEEDEGPNRVACEGGKGGRGFAGGRGSWVVNR